MVVRDRIEPIDGAISAYGAEISRRDGLSDLGNLHPKVRMFRDGSPDDSDMKYEVIPLRFPSATLPTDSAPQPAPKLPNHNVLFFFHPPLRPGAGLSYEISYSCKVSRLLTDVLSASPPEDVICYCNESAKADLLHLVVRVPRNKTFFFNDMTKKWRDISEGYLSPAQTLQWVDLEELSRSELLDYEETNDFVCRGWKARDLELWSALGIMASI